MQPRRYTQRYNVCALGGRQNGRRESDAKGRYLLRCGPRASRCAKIISSVCVHIPTRLRALHRYIPIGSVVVGYIGSIELPRRLWRCHDVYCTHTHTHTDIRTHTQRLKAQGYIGTMCSLPRVGCCNGSNRGSLRFPRIFFTGLFSLSPDAAAAPFPISKSPRSLRCLRLRLRARFAATAAAVSSRSRSYTCIGIITTRTCA